MMVLQLFSIVHWHLCIYPMLLSITASMVHSFFFQYVGSLAMTNIFAMLVLCYLLF